MNTHVSPIPERIRARVHDKAIQRVTRMYSATIDEIFVELFQNARRASAVSVEVTLTNGPDDSTCIVTVSDDGIGIADPAVLLSYGQNGWRCSLVESEDAAGMGFLSLARRGCTVVSRPMSDVEAPAPGWRVSLTPEHFSGQSEAPVEADDDAPLRSGTRVSFVVEKNLPDMHHTVLQAVRPAADYYPLPVRFIDLTGDEPKSLVLVNKMYLDNCIHGEHFDGLYFGVFRAHRFGRHEHDTNFHGLTLPLQLPSVDSLERRPWSVRLDITHCPDLELVLPARREAVQTPFLDTIREKALLAIYRAMSRDPDPRPSFEDWNRASDAGIDIAQPPAELQPWRPDPADIDRRYHDTAPRAIGPDSLLMDFDMDPHHAQAFWRAAERGGIADRIFRPNRRLEGYGWYDRLARITEIRFEITLKGQSYRLEDYPIPEFDGSHEGRLPDRPDAICVGVTVDRRNPVIYLSTDVSFASGSDAWVNDSLPLVTSSSEITPFDLADLIVDAFFCPSDDVDADSRERQEEVVTQEAVHLATRLLVNDEEARRQTVAEAIRREVTWLFPGGVNADVMIRGRKVIVDLVDAGPEEATS